MVIEQSSCSLPARKEKEPAVPSSQLLSGQVRKEGLGGVWGPRAAGGMSQSGAHKELMEGGQTGSGLNGSGESGPRGRGCRATEGREEDGWVGQRHTWRQKKESRDKCGQGMQVHPWWCRDTQGQREICLTEWQSQSLHGKLPNKWSSPPLLKNLSILFPPYPQLSKFTSRFFPSIIPDSLKPPRCF